jgi:peptide deformylase
MTNYPGETSTIELQQAIGRELPEIVFMGLNDPDEERLHTVAPEVADYLFDTEELRQVASNIQDLMRRYRSAFGLGTGFAANQIRSIPLLSMAAVRLSDDSVRVMCNPMLSDPIGMTTYPENCVSSPHLAGVVREPWAQQLTYRELDGTTKQVQVENRDARKTAHEVRHLGGGLCVDRIIADEVLPVWGGRQEILGLGPFTRLY